MNDNDNNFSELNLMREIFDDIDMKNRIPQIAKIIELTLESFGISVKVKEVDIHVKKLQFIIHALDKNISLVTTHYKDLCISLAISPDELNIDQDNLHKNNCSIYINRVNNLGYKIQEMKQNQPFNRPNVLTSKISNLLFQMSYYFFRSAEKKCHIFQELYKGKERDYKLITPYRNRYHKLNNTQLIDEFNQEVKSSSKSEIVLKNYAIQGEFDRRNLDYSAIASFQGVSFSNTVYIKDNTILIK